ncbi:SDR family oxidoreductase [Actinomadura rayongensis]|uniref:SDR family oxidoreductase n=1 Tax=Actinomadura rayongensis TaxID=1429076 RepID=A0A6I4W9X7_9ACTN|nr:SDR family oxidoreductase [Actinomadura rayongensis]MXQ63552.1 SDR family oxidoreductase [Actinomadura rayongensis]
MDLGLDGRRAAVAAASGGLGLASARALLAEGAQVAICGRDEARITAAAAGLGHGAHPIVADVGTPEGATAFVDAARAALGGIDVLVANAGGPPAGGFAATPVDAYRTALDLNLMSVVAMCHAAVPEMRERGWGRIVAITSVAVRQPNPNLILSNTARAGATAFLKTLAREVAADGVTVNSLQPGAHATDRLRQLHNGDLAAAAREVPARTTGSAEDFGAFVAYLCSRQAAFVTGAAIPVDGGQYAGLL